MGEDDDWPEAKEENKYCTNTKHCRVSVTLWDGKQKIVKCFQK